METDFLLWVVFWYHIGYYVFYLENTYPKSKKVSGEEFCTLKI